MLKYSVEEEHGWEKLVIDLKVPEGDISGPCMDQALVGAVIDTVKTHLKKHKISTINEYNIYLASGTRDVTWGVASNSITVPKQTFWSILHQFLSQAQAFRYRDGSVYQPAIAWAVLGNKTHKFITLTMRDEKVLAEEE